MNNPNKRHDILDNLVRERTKPSIPLISAMVVENTTDVALAKNKRYLAGGGEGPLDDLQATRESSF
jgi:hypothetical protein